MSYEDNGETRNIIKCKGFTLKPNSSINPQSMSELVQNNNAKAYIESEKRMQIKRDLMRQSLFVKELSKKFKMTNRKRLFDSSGTSYPFGYSKQGGLE